MNEVKAGNSLAPAVKEEATAVDHVMKEPNSAHFSLDAVLRSDKKDAGKCFDDFSVGGLESYVTHVGEDGLNLGVLDGILDEIDEVEDFDATDGLSAACEEYLLDLDFTQEVTALDHGLPDKFRVGNSSSDSHSPGYSGGSNGAIGISETSASTNQELQYKSESCNVKVKHEPYKAHWNKCGSGLQKRDITLSKLDELGDDGYRMANHPPGIILNNSIEASEVTGVMAKRQRKPPRRYIEESSDTISRHRSTEQKLSTDVSENKYLNVGSTCHLSPLASSKLSSIPVAESSDRIRKLPAHTHGSRGRPRKQVQNIEHENELGVSKVSRGRPKKRLQIIVSPFPKEQESGIGEEFKVSRGRPRKTVPLITFSQEQENEFGGDSSGTESEADTVVKKSKKSDDRRKHQRMWTLPEVTKLVDGISEYGVGRWTDIKRLSFASSSYRTPIDLRDKWRNLLRASRAQKLEKGEAEKKEKNATRPLPKPLLHRVRELAAIYPYPRKNKTRSSSLSSLKKGDQISFAGRIVHKRNLA